MTSAEKTHRIAHLTISFGCGGLEKVISSIVAGTHQSMEHLIISLYSDTSYRHTLPKGVKVISLFKKDGNDLSVYPRLANILRDYKPTVFNTYNFGTMEYQVVAFLLGIKKRYHSDHGFGGDESNGTSVKRKRIRKLLSRFIHQYIVVSEDLKKWVNEELGVDQKKITLIRNGVKPLLDGPRVLTSRQRLIHVARMSYEKNQTKLLKAFASAALSFDDIEIELIGDGPLFEKIVDVKYELPYVVKNKIHLIGHLDDPTPHYLNADAFVLSSDTEAMPMTILEAISASLPCILPKVGGIPDTIPSNAAIFYDGTEIGLEEAIASWKTMSQTELDTIINNAHQATAGYSLKSMVDKYAEIYQ